MAKIATEDVDPKEVENSVHELELKLDRLRVTYEQYFLGIQKRPPEVQQKDVVRIMRHLESLKIRNTAIRFRFRQQMQKFNSYRSYWGRTMRAIENGTYHRDLAKVRRNMADKGILLPDANKLKGGGLEKAMREASRKKMPDIRGRPAEELQQQQQGAAEPMSLQDRLHAASLKKAQEAAQQGKRANPFAASALQGALPPLPTNETTPQMPSEDDWFADAGSSAPLPSGSLPTGKPASSLPSGSLPSGSLPSGSLPSGSLPSGSLPSGSLPSGGARQRPAQAARPAPSSQTVARSSAGMSDHQMESLYRRYVKAKKMCGEDVSNVRYDALVKTIQRQLPKIQEIHKGRAVEFQVVVRGGRAILKAKPK